MALTLSQARRMVDACVARAEAMGLRQAIAIVDQAGNLITLDRMDGTRLLREQFAVGKAFAAVLFGRPTSDSAKLLETNPQLYHGALNMFRQRIYLVQGGFPIVVDGEIVGGIGVSGATGEQDAEVAQAGLRALGS